MSLTEAHYPSGAPRLLLPLALTFSTETLLETALELLRCSEFRSEKFVKGACISAFVWTENKRFLREVSCVWLTGLTAKREGFPVLTDRYNA